MYISVGNGCIVCKANTEASEKALSSSTSLGYLPRGCAIPRDPTPTCTLNVAGCCVAWAMHADITSSHSHNLWA
ncbi:hypothetical protein K439DRAFT_1636462 [Ramaria rubella]|nr:hypothetical protein K439DRAFT_1636462 [Ramaria rubella]